MSKGLKMEEASLPAGWKMKKLIELGKVQTGTTPSTKNKEFYGNFIPFVKPPHFNADGTLNFNNLGLSEIGISKGRLIKENSILMVCIGASIGKTGITPIPISCNQQINSFTPKENCSPRFFYHLLSSDYFFKKVLKLSSQATLPMINKSKWQSIEVPFPPLPQQKQIVTILDKAFAAIDTAKANAAQNLQNAKELFESYLQNVFENKGDDWEEKTLKDVTSKIGSGATPRGGRASYKEEGISLIRSMNVHDFYFKEKNLAFIDEQQASALSNVTLQEEDVLLNITGASIARCCIVPKEYLPARVNQHVSIIRAKKEIINSLFLASLLTSKFFKDKILEIGEQGATRQAITKVQLENFPISFPKTIDEQEKVIQKINRLKAETKKLEAIYTQKIADLEEMKKSILQKAFSGQLSIKS